MNFKNSERSDSHKLLLNLTDKINLKRNDKYTALLNLNIYYTWKNITSALTWNEEFEWKIFCMHDGSYSVSDIQDYFEYI